MLEILRQKVIDDLFSMKSFSSVWGVWSPLLSERIGSPPTPNSVLALGDHLSEVFRSTGKKNSRSQTDVSVGGAAWEALVCWYLNLATRGSRTIILKKKSQMPACVRNALTVRFGVTKTNTESDLVSVTLPSAGYPHNVPDGPAFKSFAKLSDFSEHHFRSLDVAVVQCKTNWNDNAQVPMLWDMLYRADNFRDKGIRLGENNFALRNLGSFKYAFVTVPTVKVDKIKPGGLAVYRVAGLSGGNYWGRPSKNGIAQGVSEIFAGARIGPDGGAGIRDAIEDALGKGQTPPYFRLNP